MSRQEFPKEFRKVFDESGHTLLQIAGLLGIKYDRLERIVYAGHEMNDEEYKKIKMLCDGLSVPSSDLILNVGSEGERIKVNIPMEITGAPTYGNVEVSGSERVKITEAVNLATGEKQILKIEDL